MIPSWFRQEESFDRIIIRDCIRGGTWLEFSLQMAAKKPRRQPAQTYLDGLGEGSRATITEALDGIARFFDEEANGLSFPWHKLRYGDAQRLRAHLVKKYKARTVNKHIAAYRGVLRACWRLGLISSDDYHHAIDLKVVKIHDEPAGRRVTYDEARRLLANTSDRRDAALITILYMAGLRRFEAANLCVRDYDRETGVVTVLKGKRGKKRLIPIKKSWRAPIETWLDEQLGRPEAPLFPSRDRRHPGQPINLRGVSYIVERTRKKAGLARLTTHDMRRSFITNLIEAGVDLVVVRRLAGHESVNTTAGYDRRGREAEDAAIDKLEDLDRG